MTDDRTRKHQMLPTVNLSAAESDWLKTVCAKFLGGYETNVDQLKKSLRQQGKWQQGFRPASIDERLLIAGKFPTLLGIWHADPATGFIDKCDTLLRYIHQKLTDSPSLSLKLTEISTDIDIPVNEISLLLRLLPSLGFGHKLSTVATRGNRVALPDQLAVFDSLTIDDPEFADTYLSYKGIEEQIRQRFGDMIDIFISHSAEEKTIALLLQSFLKGVFGADCVVFVSSDPESMEPGDWFEHIVASLKRSRVILVLISEASRLRPWVHYEAGVAEGVAMESDDRGFAKNVIPIVIGALSKSDIPWPLAHYQAGDIHEEADVQWALGRIARLMGTVRPSVDAVTLIDEVAKIEGDSTRAKLVVQRSPLRFGIRNEGARAFRVEKFTLDFPQSIHGNSGSPFDHPPVVRVQEAKDENNILIWRMILIRTDAPIARGYPDNYRLPPKIDPGETEIFEYPVAVIKEAAPPESRIRLKVSLADGDPIEIVTTLRELLAPEGPFSLA